MENIITRYRNVTVLVAILFAQVLGLAVQVKRSTENESSRLIRIWTIDAVAPLEKGIVWIQSSTVNLWHNYFYLRGVRQENRDLKQEIQRLRLDQARLNGDAEQARRLQALLGFKERFISQTVAAQVIGSSGSEQSRSILIDKGERDGIKPDMAVITVDGIVGKVLRVYNNSTSQVLLIDDQSSGVGAILEKTRVQGVLRGTPAGEVALEKIMADEAVQPGEKVLTSGGDQIFLKGLPVGTVERVAKGQDSFLNIWVKPATNLSKLEEVLVITKTEEKVPSMAETGPVRAADIMAQRLPSVPDKPADDAKPGAATAAGTSPRLVKTPPKPDGPATTKPQPGANAGLTSSQPAGNSTTETKPASRPVAVKPATEQKPAPPAPKVSEKTTKPAATEPKPQTAPSQTLPTKAAPTQTVPTQTPPVPPEDKPQ
jgi:rod shape-determining protein MreC